MLVEDNISAEEGTIKLTRKYLLYLVISFAVIAGLYIISLKNYLLFHTTAELFSIVIAFGVFMVVWNSKKYIDNHYFVVVGIAYLFIAGLDTLHTLSYSGVAIIPGHSANLPTQLWISARYMQGITLLIAPIFISRKINSVYLIIIYSAATALILLSIFDWKIFPVCYIEGYGLTAFKKISEYIISFLMLGSLVLLFRYKKKFDSIIFLLVIISIVSIIISDFLFTLYSTPYGIYNFLGHIFKILSSYIFYKAIVVTGLKTPFNLLFNTLIKKEEALKLTRFSIDNSEEIVIWLNPAGNIVDANNTTFKKLDYNKEELIGKNINFVFIDIDNTEFEKIKERINEEKTVIVEKELKVKNEKRIPFEIEFDYLRYIHNDYYCAFARDISDRKKTQQQIEASLKEKVVLLKEIHHRVKNNLQVISSLLNLQSSYIKDQDSLSIFLESQNRVKSMALIHEKLYLSKNLTNVNFGDYVRELVSSIFRSYSSISNSISLINDIENLEIDVDVALNLGLIINELVSNVLKYAFPDGRGRNGEHGKLKISLKAAENDKLILVIKDNGVGLPEGFDFRNTDSLGLQLVTSLVDQHEGNISLKTDEGTEFIIEF